jgi:hypothetical protein
MLSQCCAHELFNIYYMQRKNLRAYEYHFELQVRYCQITMRFPCTFSLHWKLGSECDYTDKNAVSENNRVVPINNQVTFNSALKLTGQMLWNADARQFLEKKVQVLSCVEPTNCQPQLTKQARRVEGSRCGEHRAVEVHQRKRVCGCRHAVPIGTMP